MLEDREDLGEQKHSEVNMKRRLAFIHVADRSDNRGEEGVVEKGVAEETVDVFHAEIKNILEKVKQLVRVFDESPQGFSLLAAHDDGLEVPDVALVHAKPLIPQIAGEMGEERSGWEPLEVLVDIRVLCAEHCEHNGLDCGLDHGVSMVVELDSLVVERELVELRVEEELDSVGGQLETQALQKRDIVVDDLIIAKVEREPNQSVNELMRQQVVYAR